MERVRVVVAGMQRPLLSLNPYIIAKFENIVDWNIYLNYTDDDYKRDIIDQLYYRKDALLDMDKEIVIAIIAAIATVITVVGSIGVAFLTNNANEKQQRIEAVREMKRTYYNSFIEAYTEKMQYVFKPESIEKVEAEMRFMKEVNRLPLYASQEMVEFINTLHDEEIAKATKPDELFELIREDLCSDDFKPFSDLDAISVSISDKVVIKKNDGSKIIQ